MVVLRAESRIAEKGELVILDLPNALGGEPVESPGADALPPRTPTPATLLDVEGESWRDAHSLEPADDVEDEVDGAPAHIGLH